MFLFLAPTLIAQLVLQLVNTADTANVPGVGIDTILHTLDFVTWVSDNFTHWIGFVGAASVVVAWFLARRDRKPEALFLGLTGAITLWAYLTAPRACSARSTMRGRWTTRTSTRGSWCSSSVSPSTGRSAASSPRCAPRSC